MRNVRYQPVPESTNRLLRRHPRLFTHYRAQRGDNDRAIERLPFDDDDWSALDAALTEHESLGIDLRYALATRFGPEMEEEIHDAVAASQPWFAIGRHNRAADLREDSR